MSGNVLGLGDNTVEYDSNCGREVLIGRLSERGKASILGGVCVCMCLKHFPTFRTHVSFENSTQLDSS